MNSIDAQAIIVWLRRLASAVEQNQDVLDRLDSGVGDGDHGATMVIALRRATRALGETPPVTPAEALRRAGRAFANVGGSIGPLWGLALLRAAQVAGETTRLDGEVVGKALAATVAGLRDVGGAMIGDRTLLDVAEPSHRAYSTAWGLTADIVESARAGWRAALDAAEATRALEPRRGRAARNPLLAAGRVDAGAASLALAWTVAVEPGQVDAWSARMNGTTEEASENSDSAARGDTDEPGLGACDDVSTAVDFTLNGRVVLVTGGTSGLGRSVAEQLARLGCRLVVGSTRRDKVEETCASITALGAHVDGVRLDVRLQESCESAVERTLSTFGRLDGLVNAAGITERAPATAVTSAMWHATIDTNLLGSLLASRACLPAMQATGGGSIVNLASLASFVAFPELSAYGASKGALLDITRSLAVEWARLRVRVNAVVPGVFITDTNRSALEQTEIGARIRARTPMGRFGHLTEVGGAVAFLLGPAASFITGSAIVVDGGFLANGV